MGCGGSKSTEVSSSGTLNAVVQTKPSVDFDSVARQVKVAWPDFKKIDRLGTKVFAHLLYKYPEFRPLYRIPEAYKTEADLLNAPEVEEAGDEFLKLYTKIIDEDPKNLDNTLREKAKELYERNIRSGQVKYYGESLVHVLKYELKDDFSAEEKQTWQIYTNRISNGIAEELAKFPRKSIV